MKQGMKLCAALIACALSSVAFCAATVEEKAPGNAFKGPDGKYRKALVIMWDGARGDVVCKPENAPNLAKLAAQGTSSFTAFTGGFLNDPVTKTATVTACGFMNAFTGVFANKHKVTSNSTKGANWAEYPSFFNRVKAASAGKAYVAGFFGWRPTWTNWVALEDTQYDQAIGQDDVDIHQHDKILGVVANTPGLDLFFLETDAPDHVGHASGFSGENPKYVAKLQQLDTTLQLFLDAVKNRPTYANENWLIIVSTDHGGKGKDHGGQSPEERSIFVVAASPQIKAGTTITAPVSHVDIHPTLMKHFGIDVKPEWKLEGKAVY